MKFVVESMEGIHISIYKHKTKALKQVTYNLKKYGEARIYQLKENK